MAGMCSSFWDDHGLAWFLRFCQAPAPEIAAERRRHRPRLEGPAAAVLPITGGPGVRDLVGRIETNLGTCDQT